MNCIWKAACIKKVLEYGIYLVKQRQKNSVIRIQFISWNSCHSLILYINIDFVYKYYFQIYFFWENKYLKRLNSFNKLFQYDIQ